MCVWFLPAALLKDAKVVFRSAFLLHIQLTFRPPFFCFCAVKLDGTNISSRSTYQLQNQLYYYMPASNMASSAVQQL
jgi:hypothetical protein